jgi:hypothetical protein
MKMHPSFAAVIAAARKQLKQEQDAAKKLRLKNAIESVALFKDDNHDFIEFYNDDAGL